MKILSFILALCVIFTSCGNNRSNSSEALDTQNSAQIEIKKDYSNYNLENFPYSRPDYNEIIQNIKPELSMIVISQSEDEALSNALKVLNEIQNAEYNQKIIFARYFLNPNNIFNRTEIVYHINNLYFLDLIKRNLAKAVESSPHKDFIKKNLSEEENFICDIFSLEILNFEDSMDYYNALWNSFRNILFEKEFSEETRKELFKILELNRKRADKNDFKDFCQMNLSFKPYSIKEIDMLIRYVKEYILPVFKKHILDEEVFSAKENITNKDIEKNAENVSDFSKTMINSAFEKKSFYSNENINFPVSFFLPCFSSPFICFPQNQNQSFMINRIIGKNSYIYCGGFPFGVQGEICGFCFDILSKEKEEGAFTAVKNLCFFSFLSEFYKYIYEEENLNQNKIKNFFTKTAYSYFGENCDLEKLFDCSLFIICVSQSCPFDFLTAAQAAAQISLIKNSDELFANNIFSSLLVSSKENDIKNLFRSVGLESPFNSQNLKNAAVFFDKALSEVQKEKSS